MIEPSPHYLTVTAAGLLKMLYSIPAHDREKARWRIDTRLAISLRKLKDSAGQYVWQEMFPGASIFGCPVGIVNEHNAMQLVSRSPVVNYGRKPKPECEGFEHNWLEITTVDDEQPQWMCGQCGSRRQGGHTPLMHKGKCVFVGP